MKNLKPIIIVDIDGTLSDATERANKYLKDDPKDWDAFYAACGEDMPIMPVIQLVNTLASKYKIVFCSGRRESCRKATKTWLDKWMDFDIDTMLFRPDGEVSPDILVKPRVLKEYLEKHPDENVLAIFEDRNSMVAKWRSLGYTCFQVADGNF